YICPRELTRNTPISSREEVVNAHITRSSCRVERRHGNRVKAPMRTSTAARMRHNHIVAALAPKYTPTPTIKSSRSHGPRRGGAQDCRRSPGAQPSTPTPQRCRRWEEREPQLGLATDVERREETAGR